jgi:hypothetical protein
MNKFEGVLALRMNRSVTDVDVTLLAATVSDHENRIDSIESLLPNIVNITASYTALYGNYSISANATSGNITVTLPTASLVPARTYSTTKVDTSSSYVRITSASLLADEVYHDLLFVNESLTFFSNGSTWEVK